MDHKRSIYIIDLILWIVITAIIILLSLLPPRSIQGTVSVNDKVAHGIAYAALGALTYITVYLTRLPWSQQTLGRAVWTLLYCIIIGGALECIQPLTGRNRELLDLTADILGALVGILAAWMTIKLACRRSEAD